LNFIKQKNPLNDLLKKLLIVFFYIFEKNFMKKIIFLLILLLILSCNSVYKIIPHEYNYSENVSFSIEKIEESNSIANGNGFWHPTIGNKFVIAHISFTNKLNQKQDLNFDDFYLLNPQTKLKHKVEWVMLKGPVNIWGNIDSNIDGNDTKKRKVIFVFPEGIKPKLLMVKEQIIEFQYDKN